MGGPWSCAIRCETSSAPLNAFETLWETKKATGGTNVLCGWFVYRRKENGFPSGGWAPPLLDSGAHRGSRDALAAVDHAPDLSERLFVDLADAGFPNAQPLSDGLQAHVLEVVHLQHLLLPPRKLFDVALEHFEIFALAACVEGTFVPGRQLADLVRRLLAILFILDGRLFGRFKMAQRAVIFRDAHAHRLGNLLFAGLLAGGRPQAGLGVLNGAGILA